MPTRPLIKTGVFTLNLTPTYVELLLCILFDSLNSVHLPVFWLIENKPDCLLVTQQPLNTRSLICEQGIENKMKLMAHYNYGYFTKGQLYYG